MFDFTPIVHPGDNQPISPTDTVPRARLGRGLARTCQEVGTRRFSSYCQFWTTTRLVGSAARSADSIGLIITNRLPSAAMS
jgi:hypothetical protein